MHKTVFNCTLSVLVTPELVFLTEEVVCSQLYVNTNISNISFSKSLKLLYFKVHNSKKNDMLYEDKLLFQFFIFPQ
jgi:hypothetical protein